MSAAITLATGDHMAALLSLMARRQHEATGLDEPDEAHIARQHAIKPLLDGGPEGAVWLVGPPRAPLGYVIVTFGWNIALGGREAWVDDLYVRPSVRRRGIGRDVIHAVGMSLRQADVRALQVRLAQDTQTANAFCQAAGFAPQPHIGILTELL